MIHLFLRLSKCQNFKLIFSRLETISAAVMFQNIIYLIPLKPHFFQAVHNPKLRNSSFLKYLWAQISVGCCFEMNGDKPIPIVSHFTLYLIVNLHILHFFETLQ